MNTKSMKNHHSLRKEAYFGCALGKFLSPEYQGTSCKSAAWGMAHKTCHAIKWAVSIGNKIGMLLGIWIKPSINRPQLAPAILNAANKS